MAERLQGIGTLLTNPYLLRLTVDEFVITVFRDGRAVVAGTDDPAVARTIVTEVEGDLTRFGVRILVEKARGLAAEAVLELKRRDLDATGRRVEASTREAGTLALELR